ncbi:MAG TPA: transposase [Micromonosporaceae bacterium]|nr:transposase [Micromonosporaceae bacterium]
MRVYCGLAASEPTGTPGGVWLTVAVVDDAGRLLDVCEVGDDAAGYAVLGALLAERSGGTVNVSVAADSDEHHVALLLATAGRALAIVDEDMVTDYADRFADDESADEVDAGPAERNAVGLARALAAGALTAATQAAPRDMVALKPVLAAHAAVAISRSGSAVALREVLRELYPAALRAYPDPAEPVPLAILDALPEPGLLGSTSSSRGRDAAVAAELARAGVADVATVTEAITALRVAIAETPRRTGVGKGPTAAVAETIRQAVAAVRAWDSAETALIGLLSTRSTARREQPVTLRAVGSPTPAPAPAPTPATRPGPARRGRAESGIPAAVAPIPIAPVPMAPPPIVAVPSPPPARTEPPVRPAVRPVARPAARTPEPLPERRIPGPRAPEPAAQPHFAQPQPGQPQFAQPQPGQPRFAQPQLAEPQAAEAGYQTPAPSRASQLHYPQPRHAEPRVAEAEYQAAVGHPHAGITQAYPSGSPGDVVTRAGTGARTPGLTPSWADESFTGYPSVSPEPSDAGYGAANAYAAPTEYHTGGYPPVPSHPGAGAPARHDAYAEPPAAVPSPDYPAPGSRELWPLMPPADDDMARVPPAHGAAERPREVNIPHQRDGRVPPPWQTDDLQLPAEPAALRGPSAPPTLRVVGRDDEFVPAGPSALDMPRPDLSRAPSPVPDEADGDLLIFAQARSAWFVGQPETTEPLSWSDAAADFGWSAAERAATPQTGGETEIGLPRRVPKANLVPGSALPPADEAQLRIVRDPAAMAAHTTGYFRGSRRGEEVRGYAVAGRPGRESGGGWDFSRDGWETDSETEYRSAAHR